MSCDQFGMEVKKVESKHYKKSKFKYFHYFSDDGEYGVFMPTSFEFETTDANELRILWKLEYFFTDDRRCSEGSGYGGEGGEAERQGEGSNSSDAGGGKGGCSSDEGGEGGEGGYSSDEGGEGGDSSDQGGEGGGGGGEGDVRRKRKSRTLHRIDISTEPKSCDADVKIFVNHKLFLKGNTNSGFKYKKNKVTIKNSLNSHMRIEIKMFHESKSIDHVLENYNCLLNNTKLCDVEFVVGEKLFPAHKQILSFRSPVFMSMFDCDMLEKKSGQVEITDIEPNIFKFLLDFIYHGKVDLVNFDNCLNLIVAADKYLLTGLVKICHEYLACKLNAENVIQVYITADLVSSQILKEECIEFIFVNKRVVFKTEAFRSLLNAHRDEIIYYILLKESCD